MLVRKTVTVLFSDVVTSTELGERLDPESLRQVMTRWFDEMRTVIERHGGTVEKFIGDEVMAVYGVPLVHEDDALRAVRAAAEMRHRLETLNEELEAGWGIRLQARTGINTGEVVAGDPATGQTFVTGEPVVMAKRLEQAAGPGEILIGKATYPLVKDAITAGPLESFPVKGKSQPVSRWRLEHVEAGAAGLARRLDTPLVGRQADLAQLRAAFDLAVAEQSCRLCTVLGPAGIGKSRLAGELLASLGDRATALTGRCLPYGEGITFWPLVQIVRDLDLEDVLADDEDAATVAERIRGTTGTAPTSAAGQETFWAIRRLVEALARPRPLVLCLEDIHWAEPTLLDLIEYLAGWTRGAPILLLCLARPDLLDVRPSWASPSPNTSVLPLEPLSESESEELLETLRGETVLSAPARTRIAEAAEGNPLFVEQMIAMVAAEGGTGAELAVPPSIQALLAERLDRLATDERAVIERASVIGKEFPRGAVVELAPPDLRPEVGRSLMVLVRKGLVEPDTSPYVREDGFRFRHALIRDAAYDGIPKEIRADLRARFADWMERHARNRAGELDEIVGYHLEQAYRLREQLGPVEDATRRLAQRAGELLGAAGRRAFARDDVPAALSLLDRAVSLVTETDPARQELIFELSSALWSVGELARAEALLQGLVEASSATGDLRQEWHSLLEQEARRSLTREAEADELLMLAEEAIRVFEELGDEVGLARAWRRVAHVNRLRCRFGVATDAGERALAHARHADETREESRIIDGLCTSLLYGPTPAERAIERCEEILGGAGGSRPTEAHVLSSLSGLVAMRGRFDEARELYRRSKRMYEDLGLRLAVAGLTQISGEVELLAGDPEAAEHELSAGHQILESVGGSSLQQALLAVALYMQGRHDEAASLARTAAGAPPHQIAARVLSLSTSARLASRRNSAAEAIAFAHEAVGLAAETDALNLHAGALMSLADVLRRGNASAEAVAHLRQARALYEQKGNIPGREAGELLGQPVA